MDRNGLKLWDLVFILGAMKPHWKATDGIGTCLNLCFQKSPLDVIRRTNWNGEIGRVDELNQIVIKVGGEFTSVDEK